MTFLDLTAQVRTILPLPFLILYNSTVHVCVFIIATGMEVPIPPESVGKPSKKKGLLP